MRIAAAALVVAMAVVDSTTAATVTYAPSNALFAQPERGIYAHREVQAEGSTLDPADLADLRANNITLVLRLYYLRSFRASPLSQVQLDLISADMAALRSAGLKAILRFAYSQSQAEPDAPLSIIQSHIDQLAILFADNTDVIATVQAGFIGSWGEWYYSSNGLDNTADRRTVLTHLLGALPSDLTVQVRTPAYKTDIFGIPDPLSDADAFDGSDRARTGHHNDCFLASDTDFGTYIDPVADKAWLQQDALYVPNGGETCNPNPPRSDCPTALAELAQLRWSFLNRDYHPTVLASWVAGGCWPEIERRLGNRLRLLSGGWPDSIRPSGSLQAFLNVTNDGFATVYTPRGYELWLRAVSDGTLWYAPSGFDLRRLKPGEVPFLALIIGVPLDIPAGRYDLLLYLPDPSPTLRNRPEYALRLANDALWEPTTGFHSLLHTVDVSASTDGPPFVGSTWLRRVPLTLGEPRLLMTRSGADEITATWIPASGAANRYHLYTGTIASLQAGAYDHAQALPGLAFPDAPDPTDGCDVSSGSSNAGRIIGIAGRPGLYFRIVEVDASGNQGPIGNAPAADPRPPTWRCP